MAGRSPDSDRVRAGTSPDSGRAMGAESPERHHFSSPHVAEQHHCGHLGCNELSGRRYEWKVGCNCQPDLRELNVQRGGDQRNATFGMAWRDQFFGGSHREFAPDRDRGW